MRGIFNKPISELFKKDKFTQHPNTITESESSPQSILNRPISTLFKNNNNENQTPHFLNTSVTTLLTREAVEHEDIKNQPKNIFKRPISELFKQSNNISIHENIQKTRQQAALEKILDHLDDEYQKLLMSFTQTHHFINKKEIDTALHTLEGFRTQFKQYLILESGLINQYVQDQLILTENNTAIMSVYRLETHKFTNIILRFLRKWTEQKVLTQQNIHAFDYDYDKTHDVLLDRIHQENNILYILSQLST